MWLWWLLVTALTSLSLLASLGSLCAKRYHPSRHYPASQKKTSRRSKLGTLDEAKTKRRSTRSGVPDSMKATQVSDNSTTTAASNFLSVAQLLPPESVRAKQEPSIVASALVQAGSMAPNVPSSRAESVTATQSKNVTSAAKPSLALRSGASAQGGTERSSHKSDQSAAAATGSHPSEGEEEEKRGGEEEEESQQQPQTSEDKKKSDKVRDSIIVQVEDMAKPRGQPQ